MKIKSRHFLTLAGAGCMALTGGMATAAADDADVLDEIIVTAQLRSESLQDVPIAITVATKEQLDRDQITTITDLQRITPALEISQTFGGESTGGGRIRGIGTNVFQQTVTGSVAMVIDDVPQGNTSFPQLMDLQQVEVLRGPQGTLFGQTASAGVLNIRTAAPDPSDYSANFGVDYADKDTAGSRFGQQIYRGMVNVPFSDGSALRLAAQYKNELGLQRNVLLDKDNDFTDMSARARFLIQPSEDWTINLMAETNTTRRDGHQFFAMSKAPSGFANSAASAANQTACGNQMLESAQEYCAELMPKEDIHNNGFSLTVDWSGESVDFKSISGYRYKNRRQFDLNYSRQAGTAQAADKRIDNFAHQRSQEFRLSSKGDGALTWVAGAFLHNFNYATAPIGNLPYNTPSAPVGFSVCTQVAPFTCNVAPDFREQHVSVTSQALFGDVTYSFNDMATLFAGLRKTRQDISFDNYLIDGVPMTAPNLPSESVEDDETTGRLGLRLRTSEQYMFYASVATGYKGSLVDVTVAMTAPIVLDPETSTAYEIGTKMSFLDNRLAVDANVFQTDVKNFQAQTNVFVGTALISVPLSIDKLKSKGLEIDVIGNFSDSLTLNAGYMYNDVKYPDGFCGDDGESSPGVCVSNFGGQQLIQSPKHKLSVSGEYTFNMGSGSEAFFNLNAVYKSEMLLTARMVPTLDLWTYPSHTTIGASFGWRASDSKWSIGVYGRNLTDENEPIAYLASTFAFGGPPSIDGGVRAWPEGNTSLRQVGITANFNF